MSVTAPPAPPGRAQGPPGGPPRGGRAPAPGDDFAQLLTQTETTDTKARTAVAEGPKEQDQVAADAVAPVEEAEAPAPVAEPVPADAAAPVLPDAVPVPDAAAPEATPTTAPVPGAPAAGVPTAPVPVVPTADGEPAAQVPGTSTPDGEPTAPVPGTSTPADPDAVPAEDPAADVPVDRPGKGEGKGEGRALGHDKDKGEGKVDKERNPNAATPAVPARGGEGPAVPVASQAPAPVLAHRAPQLHALLRLAREHGGEVTAQLQLHPADLGRVDVVLRHTSEGLVASVTAHDAVAADVLQRAADDLRAALAGRGVELAGLDVGVGTDARAGRGDDAPGRTRSRGGGDDAALPVEDLPVPTAQLLPLATGALVDVRA